VSAAGEAAALLARKTWRTLEPLHGMIYFVPEAAEAYAEIGITGRAGYFSSRAAPMGAVTADVVVATFYNFNPALVREAIPRSWDIAAPEVIVQARFRAVDAALRRLLGEEIVDSPAMARAAELVRGMAETAGFRTEGRPLCAGHTDLPWPEQPHLALWHAQSILREYRGDGHVALLVAHGLSGLEALVTHAASGEVPAHILQSTRGWEDAAWQDAVMSLRARGWLDEGGDLALSGTGAAARQEIEAGTDRLAAAPYAALGEEACAELRALARPWSRTCADVLLR
jgi:hypothetical protein